MPQYYFDVKNGTRLVDPGGLSCRDDADAICKGEAIAERISTDAPREGRPRLIAILNDEGDEICEVPVRRKPAAQVG